MNVRKNSEYYITAGWLFAVKMAGRRRHELNAPAGWLISSQRGIMGWVICLFIVYFPRVTRDMGWGFSHSISNVFC